MACNALLYVNKAYDIALTISTGNSLSVSDIASMTLTLTLIDNPSISHTYTSGAGDITISSTMTLHIEVGDITTAGVYEIAISITDSGGKDRGVTPCGGTLTFDNQ